MSLNHKELRKIAGQLIMIRFPGTVLDLSLIHI